MDSRDLVSRSGIIGVLKEKTTMTRTELDTDGDEELVPKGALKFVIESLDDADELDGDLTWDTELWEGCSIEEVVGALKEAERLIAEVNRDGDRELMRENDDELDTPRDLDEYMCGGIQWRNWE